MGIALKRMKSRGDTMIELTEKDKIMLTLLGKCGTIHNDQLKKIYGDVSKYHLKRLDQLRKENYISRDWGYVGATATGLKAVGMGNFPVIKLERHQKKRRAESVSMYFMLKDEWQIKFGTEIKRQENINRGARVDMIINNGEKEYVVYLFTETPRDATIKRLINEIKEFTIKGTNRTVIFCKNSETMQKIGNAFTDLEGIKELLLLPYNEAWVEIFKRANSPEFKDLLHKHYPGLTQNQTGHIYSDYQWQGIEISVLVTNDLVKRHYLARHIKSIAFIKEEKEIIVICTQSQAPFFSKLFPKVKLSVVTENISTFLV